MIEQDRGSGYSAKKAFEISYALFRIAESVKSSAFKEALQDCGIGLLRGVTMPDSAKMGGISVFLEYLLQLGTASGFIHQDNAEMVLRELGILNSAIGEQGDSATVEKQDIEAIFTTYKQEDKRKRGARPRTQLPNTAEPEAIAELPNHDSAVPGFEPISDISAEARQQTIFDRIRQAGSSRLKDIQELLPEISERTLRYDLQALVEKRVIERIGSSGPATYYRVAPV